MQYKWGESLAIEVRIPKEITEYKEKILFGLNIRQLLCFIAAFLIGIPTYYFLRKVNEDLASYVVIAEVIPIFALGFFKKNGFTFEKYVGIMIRHHLGINRRKYVTKLSLDKILEQKGCDQNNVISKNKTKTKNKKPIRRCETITLYYEGTEKGRKEKSKAIGSTIKAARQEFKNAERKAKKRA